VRSASGINKSKLIRRLEGCAIERLESRLLLADVSWVGPSVGSWENPANWSSNPLLPGQADDVIIAQNVMITVSSSVPTIRSIMSTGGGTLIISAGSLAISNGGRFIGETGTGGGLELRGGVLTASVVEPSALSFLVTSHFTMTGGVLIGNVSLGPFGGLFWSGGEMASPGVTRADVLAFSLSSIHGPVRLSRSVIWGGRDLYVQDALEMRNGAMLDFNPQGTYGLHLSNVTATDGGGGVNLLRVRSGYLSLEGTSSILTTTELSGDVELPEGVSSASLRVLGGGTGSLALLEGSQIRVGGLGYTLIGANPSKPKVAVDGQFIFEAGNSTFTGIADDVVVSGSAQLVIPPSDATVKGALTLSESSNLTLAAGGDVVLRARSVTVAPAAVFNVADNVVIVDYTAKDGDTTQQIRGYLTSGHANGTWNGAGINSSVAATTPGYALGYADSASLTTIPPIFGNPMNRAVLIRYTRYGDADLSGNVNLQDFNRLGGNFGGAGSVWSQANFNYDDVTNLTDFNLLAGNFGQAAAASWHKDWRFARQVAELILDAR
jgi:hypothetical protein